MENDKLKMLAEEYEEEIQEKLNEEIAKKIVER